MNSKRQRRLITILLIIAAAVIATALILTALRHNIDLYYTPKQLQVAHIKNGKTIRLGGLVKKASIIESTDSLKIQFVITDYQANFKVIYNGVLPTLFREEKGVIVSGHLQNGVFIAQQVLAKHDENYRPPDIARN